MFERRGGTVVTVCHWRCLSRCGFASGALLLCPTLALTRPGTQMYAGTQKHTEAIADFEKCIALGLRCGSDHGDYGGRGGARRGGAGLRTFAHKCGPK